MKVYSDYAARRTRQIVGDILALVVMGGWIWLGVSVYNLIMDLADFGVQMEEAGAGFKSTMVDVSKTLGDVPLIGGGIRAPFDGASDAGAALETAGQQQQEAVLQLATVLGAGIAILPVLSVLLLWLIPRVRFARRASAAQRQVNGGASLELLALRALATQKIATLETLSADPLSDWKRGDPEVVRALAQLELRSAGVRID